VAASAIVTENLRDARRALGALRLPPGEWERRQAEGSWEQPSAEADAGHPRDNGGEPDARPWPEFDRRALYGLAGEVIETIEPETEADPAGLCANFLALYGASCGRGPHAIADGGEHPARLFVVVVGQSAKARKRPTFTHAREVLRIGDPRLIGHRIHGGFGSGEAMVDTIADGEDHRLILDEAEYCQILDVATRKNSVLSRIIRCAWDGEPLIVNSRAGKSRADDAHLVVVGAITADELRAKLTSTEAASGSVTVTCSSAFVVLDDYQGAATSTVRWSTTSAARWPTGSTGPGGSASCVAAPRQMSTGLSCTTTCATTSRQGCSAPSLGATKRRFYVLAWPTR
jgi:hypothetical protein